MWCDPLVTRMAVPEELVPKPTQKTLTSTSAAASMSSGRTAALRASTTTAPTHCSTVLREVEAICAKAQEEAFPGVKAPMNVTVGTRDGVDYQNNSAMPLFGVLKKAGSLPEGMKTSRDVASKLCTAMLTADSDSILADVQVAGGGFINISLSRQWLSDRVMQVVLYGALPPLAQKKRVIVDFSSPNVAKEMHVGHLRSTIIGDTLCRLLTFCGHEVQRVNHVGDWGTQFGMLIAHLKAVFPDFGSRPPPINDLQQFYREAKGVFDSDEAFKKTAHEEVVRLQSGDGASRAAWQQICQVSRTEFEKVYSRLNVELEEIGESFYNEYIPPVIAHLTEIGIATESGGAKVIFPPGSKHEQPLIVTKSDGGFSYDSTDMAAVWYRLLERKADWLVYVTDAGQAPHFELVFLAAKAAGWATEAHTLTHCPFGLVCGEDGKKFKTRSGDVVRLVDLLDEAVTRMLAEMRNREVDMSEEELVRTAKVLGYGAVKYADLKGNRVSDYRFSFDRMLDPKGNTAVYLLYAGARIESIHRKAGVDLDALIASGATVDLAHEAELNLGRMLLRFQEVIEQAVSPDSLLPSVLCEYVYNLCETLNKFYQPCKVIGSAEQNSRLLLLLACKRVMQKSYELLGIGFLDRI